MKAEYLEAADQLPFGDKGGAASVLGMKQKPDVSVRATYVIVRWHSALEKKLIYIQSTSTVHT